MDLYQIMKDCPICKEVVKVEENTVMNEFKPCPFCGGSSVVIICGQTKIHLVFCRDCQATVSFGGKHEKNMTIAAWNERAVIK